MDPGDRAHLVVEAVKIGLRDRDDHLSDPDAMAIDADRRSTPTTWIAARRDAIDPARAQRARSPGHPQRGGTAYLCAADGDGLLVSLIQSNFLVVRLRRARARVGDQPQQPRLVVRARRDRG